MRKPDENFDPMNLFIERPLRVGSAWGHAHYLGHLQLQVALQIIYRSTALGKWPCRGLVEAIQ